MELLWIAGFIGVVYFLDWLSDKVWIRYCEIKEKEARLVAEVAEKMRGG